MERFDGLLENFRRRLLHAHLKREKSFVEEVRDGVALLFDKFRPSFPPREWIRVAQKGDAVVAPRLQNQL